MNNPNSKLYTSDITEAEKESPRYGDVEVLIANDKEEENEYEKTGNQSKAYYEYDEELGEVKKEKVGNQSKAYYSE